VPSKAVKKGEEKSVDLLSFLSEEKPKTSGETKDEAPRSPNELEHAVVSFLKSRGGKAAKSELYQWAKNRGVAPAALYTTITNMLRSGALRRNFDETAQEIVFALA
jgi:predicted aconitase with swiveling domain